jgi:PleD family two-component response regulator
MTLDIEMLSMIGFKSIRSYDGPSHTSQNIIVSTFEAEGSGVILQALARGVGDYIECRIVIWQWGRLLRRAV